MERVDMSNELRRAARAERMKRRTDAERASWTPKLRAGYDEHFKPLTETTIEVADTVDLVARLLRTIAGTIESHSKFISSDDSLGDDYFQQVADNARREADRVAYWLPAVADDDRAAAVPNVVRRMAHVIPRVIRHMARIECDVSTDVIHAAGKEMGARWWAARFASARDDVCLDLENIAADLDAARLMPGGQAKRTARDRPGRPADYTGEEKAAILAQFLASGITSPTKWARSLGGDVNGRTLLLKAARTDADRGKVPPAQIPRHKPVKRK